MAQVESSYVFTSESVTEGHPDKVCDQISDAVLDAILAKETELAAAGYIAPNGQPADPAQVRCACETLATTGMVFVTGEIRTQAYVDVPGIVREVLRDIGYDRAKYGFDCETCGVHQRHPRAEPGHRARRRHVVGGPARMRRRRPVRRRGRGRPGHGVRLRLQRDEDAHAPAHLPGAPPGRATGRGTQGRHHAVFAPRRQDAGFRALRGRSARRAWRRWSCPRSTPTTWSTPRSRPRSSSNVVEPVLGGRGREAGRRRRDPREPHRTLRHRRSHGRRGPHGPQDHRGHLRRHGPPWRRRVFRQGLHEGGPLGRLRRTLGGEERGGRRACRPLRDPGGLRHRHGTPGERDGGDVRHRTRWTRPSSSGAVGEVFDLRPAAIIDGLDLRRPIYRKTAAYGHFGRELPEFTWERTDKADALRRACGLA